MQAMQGSTWRGHAAGAVFSALALCGIATADTICVPDDYTTIQQAINAATDGDEICVAPGTYNEAIDFIGKAVRFYSEEGPDATIISGEDALPVIVQCVNGEGPDTVLEGFTITRSAHDGVGMYNWASSPTVTDCIFRKNGYITNFGHAMFNHTASPTVTRCVFSENGQGVRSEWGDTSPTVTECTFSDNRSAAMYVRHSLPQISDCEFTRNSRGIQGHAYADITVTNCTFTDNEEWALRNSAFSKTTAVNCTFTNNGHAIVNSQSVSRATNCLLVGHTGSAVKNYMEGHSVLTNCTLMDNDRAVLCDGQEGSSSAYIDNSILWNGGDEVWLLGYGASITINYSDVQGGYEGVGNIDVDPMCADPANGNFRLQAGSPCIDAADNAAVADGILHDLDGNPRFVDDPDTEDTGHGDPPIVDMGAYEFQVPCPEDLDESGAADFGDILAILSAWGNAGGPEDLDGSGTVDFGDLLVVLSSWGPCE